MASINQTTFVGTIHKPSQLRYDNRNPEKPLSIWEVLIAVEPEDPAEKTGIVCVRVFGAKAEELGAPENALSPLKTPEAVGKRKILVKGKARVNKEGLVPLTLEATEVHLVGGRTMVSSRSPAQKRQPSAPPPIVEQPSLLTVAAPPPKTVAAPIGDQSMDVSDYDAIPF